MSATDDYRQKIAAIVEQDPRYALRAYEFVSGAVSFTVNKLKAQETEAARRHVSGRELCVGIRELALAEYGPLAFDVLTEWGLRSTADVGEIVFSLVTNGLLGASEEDTLEDFNDVFCFREAFLRPFVEGGVVPGDLPKIA